MLFPAVHVYQPGNIPEGAEDSKTARYVPYGRPFSGVIFRDAFIHDEPVTEEQARWLDEELSTRVKQGGLVKHLWAAK